MNNYIDERFIPYRRPQVPANRAVRIQKGKPLTQKTRNESILVRGLKFAAVIFLLLLSTFGGDTADFSRRKINVEKAVKKCLIYVGIALALWGILVVISNLANAVTLLPTWSLILIFAVTVLAAAGVVKK